MNNVIQLIIRNHASPQLSVRIGFRKHSCSEVPNKKSSKSWWIGVGVFVLEQQVTWGGTTRKVGLDLCPTCEFETDWIWNATLNALKGSSGLNDREVARFETMSSRYRREDVNVSGVRTNCSGISHHLWRRRPLWLSMVALQLWLWLQLASQKQEARVQGNNVCDVDQRGGFIITLSDCPF